MDSRALCGPRFTVSSMGPNGVAACGARYSGTRPVSYTHLTLPTSDLGVDLGGRRIIKKKK